MNENSDQLDALLDKKEPFEISKKEISEIISPDNIASLKSYEIIDQIGGIKTLCEKLEVNPNNGLTTDDYFNSDNPKNQSKFFILIIIYIMILSQTQLLDYFIFYIYGQVYFVYYLLIFNFIKKE